MLKLLEAGLSLFHRLSDLQGQPISNPEVEPEAHQDLINILENDQNDEREDQMAHFRVVNAHLYTDEFKSSQWWPYNPPEKIYMRRMK